MEEDKCQGTDRWTFSMTTSVGAAATLAAPAGMSAQAAPKSVQKNSREKIDIFCHIIPPRYKEALFKKANQASYYIGNTERLAALTNLDLRFRAMDKYPGLKQLLNLGAPPLEHLLSPKDAVEVARAANDEMAELVNKYPDRFVGWVAGMPLNDVDASIREIECAAKDPKFKGIQMFSSVNGKPLDQSPLLGVYETMAQCDLPIFIHPLKDSTIPDYHDEKCSKYGMFNTFAWPYETTLAMSRFVFSGIMEKYPDLKLIAHHCGAMLPFFAGRVSPERTPANMGGEVMKLSKAPLDYFKRFYGDTVLGGNTPALMCGYAFFGADHMVFASDYPYPGGAERGDIALGEGIKSVDLMSISEDEKDKIFSRNARRILKLS